MNRVQKWLRYVRFLFAVFVTAPPSAHAMEGGALEQLFGVMFEMTDRCLGYCHWDFDREFQVIEVAPDYQPTVVDRDRIIDELEALIEFLLELMAEVAPDEVETFSGKILQVREPAVAEFAEALGAGSYSFYENRRQFRSGYERRQLYFVGSDNRIKLEYGAGR